MNYRFGAGRPSRMGRVTSRAHSMKRSTVGLSVLFLRVTMLTGHGRTGKSTGSTLSGLKYATDRGIAVMKSSSSESWTRLCSNGNWVGRLGAEPMAMMIFSPRKSEQPPDGAG